MKLLKKRYNITPLRGNQQYSLTAKQLYNRIMEDSSNSDYEWIASATELVRICNEPDFPEEYAKGIKVAILNCFSHTLIKDDSPYALSTDPEAVYFCYNSLSKTDELITHSKENFLRSLIERITKCHFEIEEFYHYGPTYSRICKEWQESKFKEYVCEEQLDFNKLIKTLDMDFGETIQSAEEQGAFDQEDKSKMKNFKHVISVLNDVIKNC